MLSEGCALVRLTLLRTRLNSRARGLSTGCRTSLSGQWTWTWPAQERQSQNRNFFLPSTTHDYRKFIPLSLTVGPALSLVPGVGQASATGQNPDTAGPLDVGANCKSFHSIKSEMYIIISMHQLSFPNHMMSSSSSPACE